MWAFFASRSTLEVWTIALDQVVKGVGKMSLKPGTFGEVTANGDYIHRWPAKFSKLLLAKYGSLCSSFP
jgi:hypothetical protein